MYLHLSPGAVRGVQNVTKPNKRNKPPDKPQPQINPRLPTTSTKMHDAGSIHIQIQILSVRKDTCAWAPPATKERARLYGGSLSGVTPGGARPQTWDTCRCLVLVINHL